MLQKELIFQKELTLINQAHQKNVCFVTIGILRMLDLSLNQMFLINVMMTASKLKNVEISNVKSFDYTCVLWGVTKNDANNMLDNSKLDDKDILWIGILVQTKHLSK